MLALGENREHAGNDGYDDDPAEHYSWDSTVQNHARIAQGDVIALWDRKELIGISVIEAIDTGSTEKTLYSCPVCKKADIKRRIKERPTYRCGKCGALFYEPASRTKTVTTYRSRHGAAWVNGRGLLSGSELRALCDSPNSQLSMRSVRWDRLRDALAATGRAPDLRALGRERPLVIPGGHKVATVRVRVGQASFREQLLSEHGAECAFTGPAPAAVLEAAHLYGYAATGEHHVWGGLLLRRDLHRLFDDGRLAIDPVTGRISVDPALSPYPLYWELHDRLPTATLRAEHRGWLTSHWNQHRAKA
ncbi:HNH endonuclease [Streptomyces sp. RerS4]|uniref:HNH endonuclease n=1 Tax=Streptomyces sp. RerS4 TaxID=2942449 RepID=UPI00201C2C50|nr:HNH endonuclease [Streptomyces sp. RerS4]UQX04900.1 HNH endonuclease [Streptomyces sp. RerS4]